MLLKLNAYLTRGFAADLAANIRRTHSGQAFWAGTSADQTATCGDCVFHAYHKTLINGAGDTVGAKKSRGCAKFRALTGKDGPPVPRHALACKYFERRR
jgi:hypothetical protein